MTTAARRYVDAGLLLSISSCSVIADQLAERLRTTGGYATPDVLDAIELPEDRDHLLKAEQVAKLLGVSRDAVFDLARRGGDPLPSRKIGRARRFVRAEVDTWIARQK